jgi:DNA-binding NarL/FixJ family response regulator
MRPEFEIMVKVLVVDDLPALRQHITHLVKNSVAKDAEIHEAPNGAEGLKLFRSIKPEMVVMDIVMPEMSGIKAAQEIWKEAPKTKILFWSQFHREAYVRELGKIVPDEAIHGYALKSESDEKLTYALTSIMLHDNPYIDPLVRGVQTRLASKDSSLSDVEYETLLDIMLGLTDKAIASRRHISVRGVQNRLSMLANKLFKGNDFYLKESAGMEIYNPRTRIVLEGLKRGLIDIDKVPELDSELSDWIAEEFSADG